MAVLLPLYPGGSFSRVKCVWWITYSKRYEYGQQAFSLGD
jgi:hypothetical protein